MSTPREGIHATRIPVLDVALWDVVGTVVVAVVVALVFRWPVWATLAGAFLLGVLVHAALKIKTRANAWLGL